MKFGRWSWGYIAVALVLGFLWYEYWRSGAFTPPPRPVEPQVLARDPATRAEPPAPDVPQPILRHLPPISVSFANVRFEAAVEALRQALGPDAYIRTMNAGNLQNRTFSVDMRNAPFWDVFRVLAKQAPFDLLSAAHTGNDGLVLVGTGTGVPDFQVNGPAILFPQNLAYKREGSNLPLPDEPTGPHYLLNLCAAVDPRIRVAEYSNIEIIQAVDDLGREFRIPYRPYNGVIQPSNCWNTLLRFTPLAPPAARATFKCRVRFVAQITEHTATVNDPEQKVGQTFTLGHQTLRLVRCEMTTPIMVLHVAADPPRPNTMILVNVVDANGRTLPLQIPADAMRQAVIQDLTGPFKLVFRAPDQTLPVELDFQLKDVPLPAP
jgi:hypothetical protein